MKKIIACSIFLLLIVLHACNVPSNQEKTKDIAEQESLISESVESNTLDAKMEIQQIPVGDSPINNTDSTARPSRVKAITNIDWDKKIVKTASLKIEVTDFKKYSENVYKTVQQLGGYIAQEDQNLTSEKNETVITIKVPVYQFETMMNDLPGIETKVIERKINTDDVTGKIVDVKSRLEAKKEMRLKYLEFLRQSKNMKEVLEVQAEVNNIQEQIESAAAQSNYLTHQSAVSTINLTFYQLVPGFKAEEIADPSLISRISNAFKLGGGWIADWIVGLIYLWPLLLIIGISISVWKKVMPRKVITVGSQTQGKK